MAIPQEYIAELSRRTDISELISGYLPLKRAGRIEKGLCPFHNEKTPSFCVYPETNSFFCFGCGVGGDAVTFIKNIQNLSYAESVRFLAARAGMPLPDEDDSQAEQRGRVLMINRETAKFFVNRLNSEEGGQTRAYLRKRMLTDATIRKFGLGFAPDDFGKLRDHLKANGFDEEDLLVAGVCKRSAKGGVYDAFRNRAMFPIIDLRGNVIAFGGRRMGEDGPKYLNSPDTPVFKKSRGLFALNLARKSTGKRFILAEGYMDVISLHQAGFDTAVASLGTALTGAQAKLIQDYTEEIVVCYDTDEAGQRATAKAIGLFKSTTVKATVLDMPGAKDPDEYIQKYGGESFEKLLNGSHNTIEYALQKEKKKHDMATPDGRAAYIRGALNVLAAEALPAEQDIYAGRVAEETDVSRESILKQLQPVIKQRRRRIASEHEKRIQNEGFASGIDVPYGARGEKALGVMMAEQQLVAALIKNAVDFTPLVQNKVVPEHFISPEMAQAYTLLLAKGVEGEYIDLATLSGQLPEKTVSLLSRVLASNYDIGFSTADVEMFINRILDGQTASLDAATLTASELQAELERLKERKASSAEHGKGN